MTTNENKKIKHIIMPIMLEEGVIVPNDTWGYVLSPAFMRVLEISDASKTSYYYYFTFEQIKTAVLQFCHDCGYIRKAMIMGGVTLILDGMYPDRMRRVISQLKRMNEEDPKSDAKWEWEKMLIRQEAGKEDMR